MSLDGLDWFDRIRSGPEGAVEEVMLCIIAERDDNGCQAGSRPFYQHRGELCVIDAERRSVRRGSSLQLLSLRATPEGARAFASS